MAAYTPATYTGWRTGGTEGQQGVEERLKRGGATELCLKRGVEDVRAVAPHPPVARHSIIRSKEG